MGNKALDYTALTVSLIGEMCIRDRRRRERRWELSPPAGTPVCSP